MPDVFVPLDTMRYTSFHRKLAAKNIVLENVLKYIDRNRTKLKKQYPVFDTFRSSFTVPQTLTDDIVRIGKEQNITPKDDEELQRTIPALQRQLKALIARDLWDMNEYYIIDNERNDIVQRALKEMMKQP